MGQNPGFECFRAFHNQQTMLAGCEPCVGSLYAMRIQKAALMQKHGLESYRKVVYCAPVSLTRNVLLNYVFAYRAAIQLFVPTRQITQQFHTKSSFQHIAQKLSQTAVLWLRKPRRSGKFGSAKIWNLFGNSPEILMNGSLMMLSCSHCRCYIGR